MATVEENLHPSTMTCDVHVQLQCTSLLIYKGTPNFQSYRYKYYSIPPEIGIPLSLPNNSAFIRDVSFGEREHHMHTWYMYLMPRICVPSRGVSSLESVL